MGKSDGRVARISDESKTSGGNKSECFGDTSNDVSILGKFGLEQCDCALEFKRPFRLGKSPCLLSRITKTQFVFFSLPVTSTIVVDCLGFSSALRDIYIFNKLQSAREIKNHYIFYFEVDRQKIIPNCSTNIIVIARNVANNDFHSGRS